MDLKWIVIIRSCVGFSALAGIVQYWASILSKQEQLTNVMNFLNQMLGIAVILANITCAVIFALTDNLKDTWVWVNIINTAVSALCLAFLFVYEISETPKNIVFIENSNRAISFVSTKYSKVSLCNYEFLYGIFIGQFVSAVLYIIFEELEHTIVHVSIVMVGIVVFNIPSVFIQKWLLKRMKTTRVKHLMTVCFLIVYISSMILSIQLKLFSLLASMIILAYIFATIMISIVKSQELTLMDDKNAKASNYNIIMRIGSFVGSLISIQMYSIHFTFPFLFIGIVGIYCLWYEFFSLITKLNYK